MKTDETPEQRYERLSRSNGWIGVDLDGTLAHYEGWLDDGGVGPPIPEMLERVKGWLSQGIQVRIVTARAYRWDDEALFPAIDEDQVRIVKAWCVEHVGADLPVQFWKDFQMIELWDDRAVQVIPNTGQPLSADRR